MSAIRRLGLGLAVTAVVAAWLWPLPIEAGRVLVGAGFRYDQYFTTYVLAHVARMPVAGGVFDASVCYPAASTLTTTEHLLGFAPLFAAIRLVVGDLLAAYDVFLVAMFVASGLAMAVVVLRWTNDAWAALVAGCLYACAPLRLGSAQWIHTTATFLFPLLPFALEGVLRGRLMRAVPLLATIVTWQIAIGVYQTVYAAMFAALFVSAFLLASPRPRPWTRLGWLAVAVLPALPVAWWIGRAYLHGSLPAGANDLGTAMLRQSMSVFALDPLADGAALWSRLSRLLGIWRETPFGADAPFAIDAGRVPLVLGIIGALLGVVTGGRERTRTIALVVPGLVMLLAALGPGAVSVGGGAIPLPAAWLSAVPVVGGLRTPERYALGTAVSLGILTGMALARIWRRWPGGARAAAALGLLLLGRLDSGGLVSEPVPPLRTSPAHELLHTHADGMPVLEWPPLAPPDAAARWTAESMFHGHPTTLCFTSVYPATWLYFAQRAATVADAGAFGALADQLGVGWILVHKRQATLDPAWAVAAGATLLHEDADHALYTRPGAHDRRALWNDTHASLNGVDRTGIPDSARRAHVDVAPLPELTAGTGASMAVHLGNRGPHTWPGDAPPGAGVVRLVTRWREMDGALVDTVTDPAARARRAAWPAPWRDALSRAQSLRDREHSLWHDVAPGETATLHVPIVAPPRPGRFRLEVQLEQTGAGMFDLEDGTNVLTIPVEVSPSPVRTPGR